MVVDLVLKDGRIVTPRGVFSGGLAVDNGLVKSIGKSSMLPDADRVIDLDGKYLLPGLIDGHAHTSLPPETPSTGTKAAARGGVTTLMEMPGTQRGCFNREALKNKRDLYSNSSYVDFCIHAGAAAGYPDGTLTDMWHDGVTGCKFFVSSAGPKWPQTRDGEILHLFKELSRINGLALIHAENDDILRDKKERLREEGRTDFSAHLEWRPRIAEAEAGARMIRYLKNTGCRGMIVHTSIPETVWNAKKANLEGAMIYLETCPQYLYLTEKDVIEKGPWAKFAPPPRDKETREIMRRLLASGFIDTVATDHAPYSKERKMDGLDDIFSAPNGIPGLETFLPLLLNGVNEGWINLERVAEATSENTAKIYGIYPRKGSFMPGSDADIVVVDMDMEKVVSSDEMISACGWSPYEGLSLKGWPVMSLIRGKLVMEDGEVNSGKGFGEYIQRLGS